MKTTIYVTLSLFALALLSQASVYGQTPTPTPLRRPTPVNVASPPPTVKTTVPEDGRRKAQPSTSLQNAKLILPDLVVKQIKLHPGSGLNPKRGMMVLIANIGEADASSNFFLRLVLERNPGDIEQRFVTVEPLAKGAARSVTFDALEFLNDPSGAAIKKVTATVDAPQKVMVQVPSKGWLPGIGAKIEGPFIKESNENNNTLSPDPDTIKP